MSAALEAGIEGVPAAGFSLLDYNFHADFSPAAHYARIISEGILSDGLPDGVVLNVNVPKLPLEALKGMKIARQARAKWQEEFAERTDPRGRKYYWLTGKFVNMDKGHDTDEWALNNGYVSVVPVQFDMTAHHAMENLKRKWMEADRHV